MSCPVSRCCVTRAAGAGWRPERWWRSVYPEADKIGAKPGVQFLRAAAVETWTEPAVAAVPVAPAGPCPDVDLRSAPCLTARLDDYWDGEPAAAGRP